MERCGESSKNIENIWAFDSQAHSVMHRSDEFENLSVSPEVTAVNGEQALCMAAGRTSIENQLMHT